ncbi:MAG: Undecaprenyl-phosphate 4-deoxy-4-formamido-L-arabinose transferase [Verrucomicrobiota bacterium]
MPASSISNLSAKHLEEVRAHYDGAADGLQAGARAYRRRLAHYYNLLIPADARVLEVGCGAGDLLALLHAHDVSGIDLSARRVARARSQVPHGHFFVMAGETLDSEALGGAFDVIVISDTLNLAADVQNSLWRPLLSLAALIGLKSQQPENSWLASSDVLNLLRLAGWRAVTREGRILAPFSALGLGTFANRWLAPLLQWFCLTVFITARREGNRATAGAPTVSVIIPARNAAVERVPKMGAGLELIFVEGHSRDNTWAEIQRVAAAHPEKRIICLRQTGRGKGDAVRAGFAAAKGDVLMILDADLTMPPEELPKFLDVIARDRADFANGVRLVYPMERRAMQFLNLCANKAFGLIFSWLLGQPVKDTLCGTKVLRRTDYERIAANRSYFGDFDPFGDFDLLFGAAKQSLRIADVPIRYRERTYGTTNIQRWRHGWLLLRMVIFAARKLKFV